MTFYINGKREKGVEMCLAKAEGRGCEKSFVPQRTRRRQLKRFFGSSVPAFISHVVLSEKGEKVEIRKRWK